jgi:hypothetical protein
MTTERIGAQFLLGDGGQTIETPTHVGHPGGEPPRFSISFAF